MELQEAVAWIIREKFKGNKPKNESTDAKNCGGTVCTSNEVFVMEMEQRGSVKQVLLLSNLREDEIMNKAKPFDIPKVLVWKAFHLVKANKGSAGVDRESINDFDQNLSGNLYKLWNRLSSGTYFPPSVKGLEIHPGKTKIVYGKDGKRKGEYQNTKFTFLGYEFCRRMVRGFNSKMFLSFNPAICKEAKNGICRRIRETGVRNRSDLNLEEVANWLNPMIRGWINYFSTKGVTYPGKAKRNLRYYLRGKLTRYYKRKSQSKCKLYNQGAFAVLVGKYRLIDPSKYAFG